MIDVVISLFSDGIKNTLKKFVQDLEFKQNLKDNIKFLTKNESNLDYINNDLSTAFNNEEIDKLSKELKNKRGYDIGNILRSKLINILIKYEMSCEDYSYFIDNFIKSFLSFIKDKNPELFKEYFLNKIYTLDNKIFVNTNMILKKINDLNKILDNNFKIMTISDFNKELKGTLKNEIDLEFFESDDKNFIDEFKKRIESNEFIINVVSQSIYETCLMVLNELRKYSKEVLIVFNEESWIKLKSESIKDCILIPFFVSNYSIIPAIENNINVFVFNDNGICNSRDKIFIRKRMKRTIEKKLIKYGFETREAYDLVKDTNGFFVPLMNRLYKGTFSLNYDCKEDIDIISVALIIGEWTECEGDKEIIEELSGIKYKEFIKIINKYIYGENPLFIKFEDYNIVHYSLTSKEDTWNQLGKYVNDDLWHRFLEIVPFIFDEIDPKLLISINNTLEKMICNEKTIWSRTIKNGILKTLIFINCYFEDNKLSQYVNNVIINILNLINTKEAWANLSYHIQDLIEISPDIVLYKLEKEIKCNTGFIDLFRMNEGGLFGSNPYCSYLWAIEQLLFQEKYVDRAIKLLFELNEFDIKYAIKNSPKEILIDVFCPWINVSIVNGLKKEKIAEKYIFKYKNAINIFLANLPGYNTSIFGDLSRPKYREVAQISDVSDDERFSIYKKYINLCISKSYENFEYVEKIISALVKYKNDKEFIVSGLNNIITQYSMLDDYCKEKLKSYLRETIHKHRYFSDADWSCEEDVIKELEKIMNSIEFTNKVYEYKYLFIPSYNFPLLNPISYDREDFYSSKSINDELREKEIQEKINEFKNYNYSLMNLIQICDIKNTTLGEYIYVYFSGNKYDENIYKLILDHYKDYWVVVQYARMVCKNDIEAYKDLVSFSINHDININVLIYILKLCSIDKSTLDLFINLDEKTKLELWTLGVNIGYDIEIIPILIKECIKYGDLRTYINLIYDVMERISAEEVFNYILECLSGKLRKSSVETINEYNLLQIFLYLRNYVSTDKMKKEQMASLELMFYKIIKWPNIYFLKEEMKTNPKTYSQIIYYVFNRKDKEHTVEEKEIGRMLYSLYNNAKFCPVEKNGKVDEIELYNWINKFNEYLKMQSQEHLLLKILGKLFAYSPIEVDGIPLLYAIRHFIEENYEKTLHYAFCNEEMSKRGFHSSSYGEQENELSQKYKKYADLLRGDYPYCARIYDYISDSYKEESLYERQREEYGEFF